MATAIAEYFSDEMAEWNRAIASYFGELDEFERKLEEVVQRNTIPDIAAKVEQEQDKLNQVSAKFHWLLGRMQQQDEALKTDSAFIGDDMISKEIEQQQNELRRNMQQVEKEYIEKKHDCSNFITGCFRK